MAWHKSVVFRLEASGLFRDVALVGGKVRASINATNFLDIHFDPRTRSYSYALIDMELPYSGDKRVFGWDDYPHEGVAEFKLLPSYPHHFQKRAPDGTWLFESSPMRGDVDAEIDLVLALLRKFMT